MAKETRNTSATPPTDVEATSTFNGDDVTIDKAKRDDGSKPPGMSKWGNPNTQKVKSRQMTPDRNMGGNIGASDWLVIPGEKPVHNRMHRIKEHDTHFPIIVESQANSPIYLSPLVPWIWTGIQSLRTTARQSETLLYGLLDELGLDEASRVGGYQKMREFLRLMCAARDILNTWGTITGLNDFSKQSGDMGLFNVFGALHNATIWRSIRNLNNALNQVDTIPVPKGLDDYTRLYYGVTKIHNGAESSDLYPLWHLQLPWWMVKLWREEMNNGTLDLNANNSSLRTRLQRGISRLHSEIVQHDIWSTYLDNKSIFDDAFGPCVTTGDLLFSEDFSDEGIPKGIRAQARINRPPLRTYELSYDNEFRSYQWARYPSDACPADKHPYFFLAQDYQDLCALLVPWTGEVDGVFRGVHPISNGIHVESLANGKAYSQFWMNRTGALEGVDTKQGYQVILDPQMKYALTLPPSVYNSKENLLIQDIAAPLTGFDNFYRALYNWRMFKGSFNDFRSQQGQMLARISEMKLAPTAYAALEYYTQEYDKDDVNEYNQLLSGLFGFGAGEVQALLTDDGTPQLVNATVGQDDVVIPDLDRNTASAGSLRYEF
jgi:hypothetical protein